VLAFTGGELARVIVAPSRAALRALVAELAP